MNEVDEHEDERRQHDSELIEASDCRIRTAAGEVHTATATEDEDAVNELYAG